LQYDILSRYEKAFFFTVKNIHSRCCWILREVEDYMSSRVKFVVTAQPWDDNFEEALNENPDLVFVRPRWLRACHDRQKLVPYQAHVVVPS